MVLASLYINASVDRHALSKKSVDGSVMPRLFPGWLTINIAKAMHVLPSLALHMFGFPMESLKLPGKLIH